MSIWDFFSNLFNTVGHPPTHIPVKATNYVDANLTPAQMAGLIGTQGVANQHYVRLWANRMMLASSTRWFVTHYPAVYSALQLRFGNTDVDLTNLAGPKQLGNLKPTDVNHSLQLNTQMTGLLPFRGGSIRLSSGLAQMPITNLLGSFLTTVGDFAGKLAQPQVSLAIGLASDIASGIQSLLGASEATLNLYYDNTFTGMAGPQALKSGFIFLSDAPAGSIPDDHLWVINGEPRIGTSAQSAQSIEGQNYVLIQIELVTERDDWDQLTVIGKPLQDAIKAKVAGKTQDAEANLVSARVAAYDSDDLTTADRTRVIKAINQAYADAGALVGQSQVLALAMAKAPSLEQALRTPVPSRASLLVVSP